MNTKSAPITNTPPGWVSALTTGFNTVTNHMYLILFPVVLDLLLWFGPHLRIKNLLFPLLAEVNASLRELAQPDMREMLNAGANAWQVIIERLNLISAVRTFPVGIPSLLAGTSPVKTPLGAPLFFETPSTGAALSAWLLICLIGITTGSLFYHLLARASGVPRQESSLNLVVWQALQSVLLVIILAAILLIIGIPVVLFLSIMTMFSTALTQFALLLVTIFLLWSLLPLYFSPHGIFAYHLDALRSTLVGFRMVRAFLPGAWMFLIIMLLFSQGLDLLWRVPPEDSWMAVIGIAGHAFISTGLVASSFAYYLNGIRWLQENIQRAGASGVKI